MFDLLAIPAFLNRDTRIHSTSHLPPCAPPAHFPTFSALFTMYKPEPGPKGESPLPRPVPGNFTGKARPADFAVDHPGQCVLGNGLGNAC